MTEQSDQPLDATPGGDARVPVLAIVGRPNVGKSTLVNRIIGRREAVVEDVPGVTRDRVPYDASWNGRAFTVVDTGGWDPDARGMAQRIAGQAEIAISLADAVLFVVDATVGITDFAQEQLGDVVYIGVPETGATVNGGEEAGVAESVKSASDVFSPVTGEVIEINEKLEDEPEIVNEDPYGDGWMFKVKLADEGELEGLMDAAAYAEHVAAEE